VLDTASLLTQDKKPATYNNKITIFGMVAGPTGPVPNNTEATVGVGVTPTIKSERSGLIELPLNVTVDDADTTKKTTNTVNTTISVRDRQSAAFAGIIKKKSSNEFGGDPNVSDAIVTFQSRKKYDKSSSNFVVFITPIIKSSASAGVDQVKKKFRLRE
jgi:pilus assembly protein CpaC